MIREDLRRGLVFVAGTERAILADARFDFLAEIDGAYRGLSR